MGKPKSKVFRLLRSCLFFSGHKRDSKQEEAEAMDDDVKLGPGGRDHPEVDGEEEGHVSAAVSSSPEPPQLPEDIIFEVLARLPVKTLCRLRCVSKAWRAVISSPAFASAQASRAVAPLVAGVFGTPPRPIDKFLPARAPRFLPEASVELRVMDAADGGRVLRVVKDVKSTKLMCGARLGRLVMVDQGERGAMVVDPVTGRVMVLDGGSSSTATTTMLYNYSHGRTAATAAAAGGGGSGDDDINNAVFAYRLCYHNLGRATPSGAYKAVRLHDGLGKNGIVQICHVATVAWPWDGIAMEELTSSTRWRQRPEPPIVTCCCSSCTAVVDGVLHFMNYRCESHSGHPPSHSGRPPLRHMSSHIYIVRFDLESEEWKETIISGPSLNSKVVVRREMALAVLQGSLCLFQTDVGTRSSSNDNNDDQGSCCFTRNIWFLVDPERSIWVKKYAIQTPQSWCLFKPLEVLVDGRILMLNAFKKKEESLYDVHQSVLQLYHPSTGALTDLMEMGSDFRGPLTLYTGSLFS